MTIVYDEYGPEKIIQTYDPATGTKGILVIHNTALGPGKGGTRITPSVSVEEVYRLAETMTWKCSIAGLPFGGAKSGIVFDAKTRSKEDKKKAVQAFARSLRGICPREYVGAPDVNSGEEEMRWFAEANGSWKACTGKPKDYCIPGTQKCGIPHEFGSTGFGVAHSTRVALEHAKIAVSGARIAIEGFGNVGSFAFKHLQQMGAKIVAISDSKGCVYNEQGLDFSRVEETKKTKGTVADASLGQVLPGKQLFELPVEVVIPGALPDVITAQNVENVKANIVVEAANIPMTPELEQRLHEKSILVVPDFVANAGGVISSYAEYKGLTSDAMFKLVEKKVTANTRKVLRLAKKQSVKPRDAAMQIARERVKNAMQKRAAKQEPKQPQAIV